MEYVEIDKHDMHLFRAGDENRPKLVFMSGSGTVAPVYDFKILYNKLVSDYRVIVIEKFGYGNTAQFACGISWKICVLISSLFLEVHKVHLRKSAFIRTQIFSGSALAELCGVALTVVK